MQGPSRKGSLTLVHTPVLDEEEESAESSDTKEEDKDAADGVDTKNDDPDTSGTALNSHVISNDKFAIKIPPSLSSDRLDVANKDEVIYDAKEPCEIKSAIIHSDRIRASSDSFGETNDKFGEEIEVDLKPTTGSANDSQQDMPAVKTITFKEPDKKALKKFPRPPVKATGRQMSAQNWSDLVRLDVASQNRRASCIADRGSRRRVSIARHMITSLRIRDGEDSQMYLIKLKYTDTLETLRQYLRSYRDQKDNFQILRTYPCEVLDRLDATMTDLGLVPNATLHLRTISDAVKNKDNDDSKPDAPADPMSLLPPSLQYSLLGLNRQSQPPAPASSNRSHHYHHQNSSSHHQSHITTTASPVPHHYSHVQSMPSHRRSASTHQPILPPSIPSAPPRRHSSPGLPIIPPNFHPTLTPLLPHLFPADDQSNSSNGAT